MNRKLEKLGSATSATKDFTGFYAWDGFLYDFRKWKSYT